jgi:hypothetical protein
MKYRLEDGRVIKSGEIYGETSPIVEWIPERSDRFWRLFRFPFANVAALALATVVCGAVVGAFTYHHGWSGAANGAWIAGGYVCLFFFTGAFLAEGVFENAETETRAMWRVLLPWAILAVAATAWTASTRPWLF